MIKIPEKCKFIFEYLENNGFECFAVGGCVRDSLMGENPQDWDFTTNATPEDICRVFSSYKLVDIGRKYGTISVVKGDDSYEITTYRSDGGYSDCRHPDNVTYSESIIEDLSRRDFTMNSIAYSPGRGIIDPFGGREDIKNRLIRCTGEPMVRLSEDALRILRAVRFSSTLAFEIEKNTSDALCGCKDNLSSVHPFRMRKEIEGIIMGKDAPKVLSAYSEVLAVVIPEISPMFSCVQNNPHHKYDVWHHTLKALEFAPADEAIRFALFFHDVGKPHCKTTDEKGVDHFKKHQMKSAEIAEGVLRRFGWSSDIVNDVTLLVRYHDERFRKMDESIKLTLRQVGERLFPKLLTVTFCDISAQSSYKQQEKLNHLNTVKHKAKRIIESKECYSLAQMCINGQDVVASGYSGREVGVVLDDLLTMVIKGKLTNTKDDLLYALSLRKNSESPH